MTHFGPNGRHGNRHSPPARDDLAINGIVYAELSVRYATIEELDAMIREASLFSATIPRSPYS